LARPGGYSVRVLEPLQFPPGTSYREIVQTCWDGFEPIIRQHPEQWLWVYKHLRYLPASSDRPYPFYPNRSERSDRELESQGLQSLFCAFVRRKHRVKNLRDLAIVDDQRQTFDQNHRVEPERRKFERVCESQLRSLSS
jgi:hypothetical protein